MQDNGLYIHTYTETEPLLNIHMYVLNIQEKDSETVHIRLRTCQWLLLRNIYVLAYTYKLDVCIYMCVLYVDVLNPFIKHQLLLFTSTVGL